MLINIVIVKCIKKLCCYVFTIIFVCVSLLSFTRISSGTLIHHYFLNYRWYNQFSLYNQLNYHWSSSHLDLDHCFFSFVFFWKFCTPFLGKPLFQIRTRIDSVMKNNSPTAIFKSRLSASYQFFSHSKIKFLFSYVLGLFINLSAVSAILPFMAKLSVILMPEFWCENLGVSALSGKSVT